MFVVYVLYSPSAEKHYTGFTSDLQERIQSHNKLGKEWTARHRHWNFIFLKALSTKKEAMKYEKWLKSGQGRNFVNDRPH